ncbi:MAG: hypothetical protein JSS00_02605 [Proteobacteria bacterium]|nr:hypothetical protein [Pseudomonadota bacterium]
MKYGALKSYLASRAQRRLRLSFDDVARIAKVRLPASAFDHPAWWANDSKSHVQAKAWLEAGYKTENVDLAAQSVEFVRVDAERRGVREAQQNEFEHDAGAAVKRHPMAGALKGTFSIAPGWDLTRPALDPEELAEWEANLDRKADMIVEGLRHRK